jgi:hypothetical protein
MELRMLEDLKPHKYIQPCFALERVREHPESTEKDVEIMKQYLDDAKGWPVRTLEIALKSKGIFVDRKSIERHREGRCPCWKI